MPNLDCTNIGCGCDEPPYLPLMGFVASYKEETCTNTCNFTDAPSDPCRYYLGATVEGSGFLTGRSQQITYSPTANDCGKDCGEAAENCTGSYTVEEIYTENFTYPCGSAVEKITSTEIISWEGECDAGESGGVTFNITECSGSLSVGTISGEAKIIDGLCQFELTDSENEGLFYATPYEIGFGTYDFGGDCAGQEQVSDYQYIRTPPEEDEEVIDNYAGENNNCIGWCGPELEEIVDLGSHEEWEAAPQSISVFAGSSLYGNIKVQETAKIKFAHTPSPTCYLKVWFRKTTTTYTPSGSDCGPIFSTNPEPESVDEVYIWNGAAQDNGLCVDLPLTDENLTPAQVVYDDERTITPDAANGESVEVEFKILKWSFVPDYEPNDPDLGDQGCKPNGFPLCSDD